MNSGQLCSLPAGAAGLGAEVQAPEVRRWIDRSERADLAGRLRFLAEVLDHSDDLAETLDLARDILASELRRLS